MQAGIPKLITDVFSKYDHVVFGEYHGVGQMDLYNNPALHQGLQSAGVDKIFWESMPQNYQGAIDDYSVGFIDRAEFSTVFKGIFTAAKIEARKIAEKDGLSADEQNTLKETINHTLINQTADIIDGAKKHGISIIGLDPSTQEVGNFFANHMTHVGMGVAYDMLKEKAETLGYPRIGLMMKDARDNNPEFAENYNGSSSVILNETVRNILFNAEELQKIDAALDESYLDISTKRDRRYWEPVLDKHNAESGRSLSISGFAHTYVQPEDGIDEILGGDSKTATILIVETKEQYDEILQMSIDAGDPPHGTIILDEGIFIPTEKLDIDGYTPWEAVDVPDINATPIEAETPEISASNDEQPVIKNAALKL